MIEQATDEMLEMELITLMRRAALTNRALTLAEEMWSAAEQRHNEVIVRLDCVNAELERRYDEAAQSVGVPPAPDDVVSLG